jgi:type IV secretion system protein VirB9
MRDSTFPVAAAWLCGALLFGHASAEPADPRLREVWYDPQAVVTIHVKRGVVTDIVLDPGESITDVATGLGADCSKPEASWCVAAQPGGRHVFVKPKSTASAPNNLAVVTDKRTHSFRLEVLADGDRRVPVYRLSVRAAPPQPAVPPRRITPVIALPEVAPPRAAEVVAERLSAAPVPVNSSYSIAEARGSEDILPSLVFDDGRFTYLRFAANREVPAVFHVLGDGSETLVNVRMEGDLLVVDRVSRRLMLRSGSAVVGVWNEAFDLDGVPPQGGTTAPGVERAVKGALRPARNGDKR